MQHIIHRCFDRINGMTERSSGRNTPSDEEFPVSNSFNRGGSGRTRNATLLEPRVQGRYRHCLSHGLPALVHSFPRRDQ
jgi:hypothetical protein